MDCPLAQSVERGADNAKVVSSTLTRTTQSFSFFFHVNWKEFFYEKKGKKREDNLREINSSHETLTEGYVSL